MSKIHDRRQQNKPFGPFETIDQFHKFLGLAYCESMLKSIPHSNLILTSVLGVRMAPESLMAISHLISLWSREEKLLEPLIVNVPVGIRNTGTTLPAIGAVY